VLDGITELIAKPFGLFMTMIYETVAFGNYGLAIIFFAIFVKILMLPLQLKQQKSMIKNQAMQAEMEDLKKRCAGDKKKFQEEQMKLYEKNHVSPMSGCLPLLIQMPIILVLYKIIRQPLTYIAGTTAAQLIGVQNIAKAMGASSFAKSGEIAINRWLAADPSHVANTISQLPSGFKVINMNFLGIFNLGEIPSFSFSTISSALELYLPLLLIPILAGVSTFFQIKYSMPKKKEDVNKIKKTEDAPKMPMTGNTMKIIMPIMTAFFAFSLPAGLGIYWIINNLLAIGQTALLNKLAKKKEGYL